MGGQMQELLIEVSKNLAVVERLLDEVKEAQKDQSEQVSDLRDRVVALEATEQEREKWSGQERRKVDDRLGSGDKTFLAIRQEIKDAESAADRAASIAKTALDAIDAHTSGSHGQPKRRSNRFWTLVYKSIPYVVPALISGLAWLFLHIRIVSEIPMKAGHP